MKRSLLFIALVFTLGTLGSGCGKKNPTGPSQPDPTPVPTVVTQVPTAVPTVVTPVVTPSPTQAITLVYSGSITNNTGIATISYDDNGDWYNITVPVGGGSWAVTLVYENATSCVAGFCASYTGDQTTSYSIYCKFNGVLKGSDVWNNGSHYACWGPGTLSM